MAIAARTITWPGERNTDTYWVSTNTSAKRNLIKHEKCNNRHRENVQQNKGLSHQVADGVNLQGYCIGVACKVRTEWESREGFIRLKNQYDIGSRRSCCGLSLLLNRLNEGWRTDADSDALTTWWLCCGGGRRGGMDW